MYFSELAIPLLTPRSQTRLNPYCIGCTSLSAKRSEIQALLDSLNPYCIGCTSLSGASLEGWDKAALVLILIVLDVLL